MTTNLKLLKEKLTKIKNSQTGTGNNEKYFRPEEGENIVRLLPYENKEDGLFYVETKNHRITENGKETYVTCLHHYSKGEEKCPVCQIYFDLWKLADKKGDETLKKFASSLRGGSRFMYNILDRSDNKVKVASVGIKLHEAIGDYFFDSDYGDLTDIEKGYDFKINKTIVDGKWPNYDKSRPLKDPNPLVTDGDPQAILAQMHTLEDEIHPSSFEELQSLADIVLVKAGEISSALTGDNSKEESKEETGASYTDHLDSL